MINEKCQLAIGFTLFLISSFAFAEIGVQLPAGTYLGIVQEFDDPYTNLAGEILDAGEFLVEENGALNLTTPDGVDVRFVWEENHWLWEFSESGQTMAIPRRVGSFYVISYVAFESGERVGHVQFFLFRKP